MAGRWAEGVPLLLRALDIAPAHPSALDDLASAATFDPVTWTDELFTRLDRAALAAEEDARRDLRWMTVGHAAIFGRLDRISALLDSDEDLVGDDAARAAQRGALEHALGRAEGVRHLAATPSPLALYHRGRIAALEGTVAEARAFFELLTGEGPPRALREMGLATIALAQGGDDPLAPARSFFARIESAGEDLPMYVVSEGILLRVRVALALLNNDEARWHGRRMGAGAAHQDPSALLRAAALLGPLRDLQ